MTAPLPPGMQVFETTIEDECQKADPGYKEFTHTSTDPDIAAYTFGGGATVFRQKRNPYDDNEQSQSNQGGPIV